MPTFTRTQETLNGLERAIDMPHTFKNIQKYFGDI